jgi:NTE family protein
MWITNLKTLPITKMMSSPVLSAPITRVNKMFKKPPNICGLVMTGGGARGAYQAGVLKAISELSDSETVPFSVISGVSVGALNAAGLASRFESFDNSAKSLEAFWRSLTTNEVFDTRLTRLAFTGLRMVLAQFMPSILRNAPRSLLDNRPLWTRMKTSLDLEGMSKAVETGGLHAISVTCSGYTSGHAVSFFESTVEGQEWHRARRDGHKTELSIKHIMASAALPALFPAVRIENEYYGDGALRLTSPLAPAIHLGADRLLIIGTRDMSHYTGPEKRAEPRYPSVGDLGGYALDTVFNDNLEADIERLQRINKLIEHISKSKRKNLSVKPIEYLTINPSRSLKAVALEHIDEMPRSLRWIISRQRPTNDVGRLDSYLLFEQGYIGALIDLGYADAMAKKDEVLAFVCS